MPYPLKPNPPKPCKPYPTLQEGLTTRGFELPWHRADAGGEGEEGGGALDLGGGGNATVVLNVTAAPGTWLKGRLDLRHIDYHSTLGSRVIKKRIEPLIGFRVG